MTTSPDTVDELAGRLALAIGRINRRMRATGDQNISHGLLSALSSLVKGGELRLGELAEREAVAPATITRIVAELEIRGLVAREVDPGDRRSFLVRPTEQGVDLVLRARSKRATVISALLEALEEADRSEIARCAGVLEKMATAELKEGVVV